MRSTLDFTNPFPPLRRPVASAILVAAAIPGISFTASQMGTRIGGGNGPFGPDQTGPTGLIAYALKK
jgi:hypothetical protein